MPTPRIENLDTERIAHIMTIALKEFAEHNYHKSSFNRIIKNCGISKGTMYYYFENKQDLFMTLLNATTKEFQGLVGTETPAIGEPGQYWLEVNRLLKGLLTILYSKPTLGRFIQNFLTTESRKTPNPTSGVVEAIDEWLEDFILTGQLVGAVRRDLPIDLLAHMSWGIWETCSLWLQTAMEETDADQASEIMLDFFQRTLRNIGDA